MAWDSDVIVFSIILVFVSSVKAQPDIAAPDTWRDHNHMRDKRQHQQQQQSHRRSRSSQTQDLENTQQLRDTVHRLEAMYIELQSQYQQMQTELEKVIEKQKQDLRPRKQVHCRSAFTWWHDTVGKSLEYLDNFDIHCSHGEFLRQWRMTWGEMSGKKAIRYVCCRFHYEPD